MLKNDKLAQKWQTKHCNHIRSGTERQSGNCTPETSARSEQELETTKRKVEVGLAPSLIMKRLKSPATSRRRRSKVTTWNSPGSFEPGEFHVVTLTSAAAMSRAILAFS